MVILLVRVRLSEIVGLMCLLLMFVVIVIRMVSVNLCVRVIMSKLLVFNLLGWIFLYDIIDLMLMNMNRNKEMNFVRVFLSVLGLEVLLVLLNVNFMVIEFGIIIV